MYRLRQVLGELEERLLAVTPETEHRCAHTFEPPLTSHRAIVSAINQLFLKLLNSLHNDHLVAQHFHLTVQDTTMHSFTKEFRLASASADRAHLRSIVTPLIESFRFSGEIRTIALQASRVRTYTTEQQHFSPPDQPAIPQRAHDELINALTLRIGQERVLRASLHQSYIPERSFSYTPLTSPEPQAAAVMEPLVPYNLQERPSIILKTPEPISTIAALPDKPPAQICWRDTRLSILSGVGPERLAPEWWRQHDNTTDRFTTRDYFKVQDQYGRWLWVFREDTTMNWFLHGMWL
jgi:protein ImuB